MTTMTTRRTAAITARFFFSSAAAALQLSSTCRAISLRNCHWNHHIAPFSAERRNHAVQVLFTPTRFYSSKKKATGKEKGKGNGRDEGVNSNAERFDISRYAAKMQDAVAWLKREYMNLRVGRATPALLDPVRVTFEGQSVKLTDVAQIFIKDAANLIVALNDPAHAKSVEKALLGANLNLNPVTDIKGFRIPIPKMNKEARDQMARKAQELAEKSKMTIRKVREGANTEIGRKRDGESTDDRKRMEKEVDALVKKVTAEIVDVCKKKVQDITNN